MSRCPLHVQALQILPTSSDTREVRSPSSVHTSVKFPHMWSPFLCTPAVSRTALSIIKVPRVVHSHPSVLTHVPYTLRSPPQIWCLWLTALCWFKERSLVQCSRLKGSIQPCSQILLLPTFVSSVALRGGCLSCGFFWSLYTSTMMHMGIKTQLTRHNE